MSIYYHGQATRNLTLDYVGTGNDQYGIGLYFTSILESAQLYGNYIYQVDSNDYNIIKGNDNCFNKKMIKNALNFLKKNNSEEYYYTVSDWDENENLAVSKLIDSILDGGNNLEITQTIWWEIFKNNEKLYLDFMQLLGIDGIEFDVQNGEKFLILYKIKNYKEVTAKLKRLVKKASGKTLVIVDVQLEFSKFFNEDYLEKLESLIEKGWDRVITVVDDNDGSNIPLFLYNASTEIIHKAYGGIDEEYINELIESGEIEIIEEDQVYRYNKQLIVPGNVHENFMIPEDMELVFKKLQQVTIVGGADQACLDDIENALIYLGVNVVRDYSCIYGTYSKNSDEDWMNYYEWVNV